MWLSRLRVALRYSSVDLEYKLHYVMKFWRFVKVPILDITNSASSRTMRSRQPRLSFHVSTEIHIRPREGR